jgi:hypothetical protein
MRTISQKDLNREKKRKGVSVIRKLGSQPEKPEPEVNGSQSLSGETTRADVVPAPASEFYSLMGKMTEIMERLSGVENEEKPKEEGTQETKPEEVLRPFQLLKEMQDADELPPPQLVVSKPKADVTETPKQSSNWDHVLRRDGTGLVQQIVSIDKTGNQWTHDFARAGTKFIIEILSKSNTGLRFMHKFHRNDETKLIDTATTRAEA